MKQVKLADLVAQPKNNYLNNFNLTTSEINDLTASIRAEGIKIPLLVQKKTNIVIDGYNRYAIAKKLKLETVPVEYVNIKTADIEKEQIVLQIGRRNLKDADRKILVAKLINLGKITPEDAPKLGVSKNTAKFAAKVDKLVQKSGGKATHKQVQKLIKTKGVKETANAVEDLASTNKTAKKVIKQAVKEKKTKMTAHQVIEKPMRMFEEAFDEYPQYQEEFVSILESFLKNL